MHDGLEVNLFGRDQRKALAQIKAHLVAKNAFGTGASAVRFEDTMRVYMAHEVFVLGGWAVLNWRHVNKVQAKYQWHP